MSKGTPSMGKRNKQVHMRCRRCGRHSYHKRDSKCAHCGFGSTATWREYRWVAHKKRVYRQA